MPRQVVVPGMHRSGTSMVAGVLQRLGVFMGEHLQGADSSNAKGHYEDLEFQAINKAILAAAGGSWRHPPSHEAIMSVTKYDRQMADLVARRDAEHELWGWKDPRTMLTLRKWEPFLKAPLMIYVSRERFAVVASLMRRNGLGEREAHQLCQEYEDRMPSCTAILASYECMVDNPEWAVFRLAQDLNLPYSEDAVAFIDPALDHSRVATCA